jgi:hypothetical protein
LAVRQQASSADPASAAIWVGLVLLYLAVRLPLLPVPLERDEGLFGVMGQAVLRGDVPYRDVFEHKPPGVFYLYALALLFVPPTAVGVHAFLAVWNFATALCVGSLAAALAGRRARVWAVLLFIVASAAPSVQGFSASTEMLLLLPLTASVRLALAGAGAGGLRRALLLAASGGLAAATFWIKQPAVLAAAAGPLVIVAGRRGDLGAAARDLVPWITGVVVVTLGATLPFVLLGAGREFWYWAFEHSWLYGQLPVSYLMGRLAARVVDVSRDLGFALVVALAGAAIALRRGRSRAWIALAFLGLSIASAFQSKFLYAHYFALLVPAVAVAGGAGLAWMEEACGPRGRTFAIVAAVLALAVPVAARPWYWLGPDPVEVSVRTIGAQGFEAAPLVAAYLRERTGPEDRIFIYGSEPEIAFIADRRDVNPFGMVYPLTWTWPRHREFQERVWAEIEQRRPTYILLAHTPYTLVRSPAIDPFFEQHLTALGRQAYRLEAVLLVDPVRGLRFAPSPPEPSSSESEAPVLYEIWRRRE